MSNDLAHAIVLDTLHCTMQTEKSAKKQTILFLVVLSALSSVVCETKEMADHDHEHNAIDMSVLRDGIAGHEDAFARAQMAGDAEGVIKYYADDAISLAPNKPAAKVKRPFWY